MITDKQIQDWVALLQKAQDEHFTPDRYKHVPSPLILYSRGKKYTRIIKQDRHYDEDGTVQISQASQSVFCFIDEEGNLWKAASWKAPAKNFPRGHINTGLKGTSIYGCN